MRFWDAKRWSAPLRQPSRDLAVPRPCYPSCPQCIPIAVVPGNGIRHYLVQLTGNQYHVKDGTRCKNARFNLLAMRSSGCFAISSQTAVADL